MTSPDSPRIPDDASGAYPGPTEAEVAELDELDAAGERIAARNAGRNWAEVAVDDAAAIVAAEAAREAGLDPLSVLWDD